MKRKSLDNPGRYWFLSLPDEVIEQVPWLQAIAAELLAAYPEPQPCFPELLDVEVEIEIEIPEPGDLDLVLFNQIYSHLLHLPRLQQVSGFRRHRPNGGNRT